MKNFERFQSADEAEKAYEQEPCIHHTWAMFKWAYAEVKATRKEQIQEYIRLHITTNAAEKEIRAIERAEKKAAKEVRP